MAFFTTDDEQTVLAQLREGSSDAYMLIYCRFQPPLYTHLYKKLGDREEVMDIIHDLFADLWEKRETLNITNSLAAYLFQAVRYQVIGRLDKARSAQRYLDSLDAFAQQYVASTDHRVRENMLLELIEKEIDAMPPRMKAVFELSRKEGLSHKEIAEMLQISEQSVRSHVKNALRILRLKIGFYLIMVSFWEI